MKRRRPSATGTPAAKSFWVRPVTLATWWWSLGKIWGRMVTVKVSVILPPSTFAAPIWMISPRKVCSAPW